MAKLYRKQMAELAGMTPVQYDYFVRIGAFAPDLGDSRKHFSPHEAALVLIAGQLAPYFKDQRTIVSILERIRKQTQVHGVASNIAALQLAATEEEKRHTGRYGDEPHPFHFVNHYFLLKAGFYNDSYRGNEAFMEVFCRRNGLDFSHEEAEIQKRIDELCKEPAGRHFDTVHGLFVKQSYLETIAGSGTHYLQVSANSDGTADVALDTEPMAFDGRIFWMTLSLGDLFKRLSPYIDSTFARRASDYLKDAI